MPADSSLADPPSSDDPADTDWTAALARLTESEGAVLALRHGAFEGQRLPFGSIARQLGITEQQAEELHDRAIAKLRALPVSGDVVSDGLGDTNRHAPSPARGVRAEGRPAPDLRLDAQRLTITKQRAHQLHHRAIEVLRHRDETRELAEKLAAIAVPVEVESEPMANKPTGVADPAPTKRDRTIAMKLVKQADRELARAIEQCVGREELVAELQRARTRIAAGLREIDRLAGRRESCGPDIRTEKC